MQDFTKDNIQELFPDERDYKAIELIKRIKKLIPVGTKSGVDYLDTLITYLDGLLNGDEIHQYGTFKTSEFAKIAFRELLDEIQSQVLEEFRQKKDLLESEVSTLSSREQILSDSVSGLEKRKDDLQGQTGILSVELASLKKELEDLRTNGLKRVNDEISSEKERLCSEVSSLSKAKEELSKAINDYYLTVSKLNEDKDEEDDYCVSWKPLDEENEDDKNFLNILYSSNYVSMKDLIGTLKAEYMDHTGLDESTCDSEFTKHCPSLNVIVKLMDELSHSYILSGILNMSWNSPQNQYKVIRLRRAIDDLKRPVYFRKSKKNAIYNPCISSDTIPSNISSIIRELRLERIAMEEVTKRKGLEAQLRKVIRILKSVVPSDYDFSGLVEAYSDLGGLIPMELSETPQALEESSTLKLE